LASELDFDSFSKLDLKMVAEKETFCEGACTNWRPLFAGENYPFRKVKVQIFLESIDRGVWDVVVCGPYIPTINVNNVHEPKPFSQWTTEENQRAQYGVRTRNIISFAFTHAEFYMIFFCKRAKETWDVLEVTHEGTNNVKKVRKNTLIQKYEMF